MEASTTDSCEAISSRGERCRKRKARGRYCLVHSGVQDMRELGRKGGSVSPQTKLRKAADDTLREKARSVLERALAGEDVPKTALDSARSLFSYRPSVPAAELDREQGAGYAVEGHRPTSLADVMKLAAELNQLEAMPDVLEAAKAIVASAEAGGAAGFSLESRSTSTDAHPSVARE